MNIWKPIDDLEPNDERFRQVECSNFGCDRCEQMIQTFPVYNLQIPNRLNSIDFCKSCFEAPFEITCTESRKARFPLECLFCVTELFVIPTIAKISDCNIKMYVCENCAADVEKRIRETATRVTSDSVWIERRKPILANVQTVTRNVSSKVANRISTARAEMWVSNMEDIVLLPIHFGSLKQWCAITDEIAIGSKYVFLIVDCGFETADRVAAVVSDEYCRVRIYYIFDSIQELDKHEETWRLCANQNSDKLRKQIQRLIAQRDAPNILRNFIGYFMLQK